MINYMRKIISGESELTSRARYEIARIGVGSIHIILVFAFVYIGCLPLVIFNCFSVFFYGVISEILIKKEKYMTVFASSYLEIVLHSFFASVLLGWSFAFALYNIGLIYIAYYFSYFEPRLKKKILFPTVLGSISLILTIMMRLCSYYLNPVFTDYPSSFLLFISCMNTVVSAIMIMSFATLHTVEIRRKSYQLMMTNESLDKMAHYDALTKLRNRYSMEEELHAILDQTETDHCFIMGDIDDFKLFNDTYGHSCGDYVLQEVAGIVIKNMDGKHIACRWGGEEILILVNGNLDYARIIAEKIRYEIEHTDSIYRDKRLHVTMTLGVAPCTKKNQFESCIRVADKRLYYGKQNGKNCVVSSDA